MITCTLESGKKTSMRHVVVHAIVEMGGKLLLEKRALNLSEGGKWALPGGFLDRDETAGEGVIRELREETGWEGEVLFLFRLNSKPDRPKEDRQNVALEFIIKPLRQLDIPLDEVLEVKWIAIEEIYSLGELAFDHGETIDLYLKYRKQHFSLPVIV